MSDRGAESVRVTVVSFVCKPTITDETGIADIESNGRRT